METVAELCVPQLLNSSCKKPTLWSKAVLLNIVLSFISFITAALNLLVIISVSHFRQLHTPSNILLLSLAVSDFLVGLLLMPAELLKNTACWVLGDFMCSLNAYLGYIVAVSSIGTIVLISVDRYVAICDPLHYPTRITVVRVKLSIFLLWFYSIFYSTIYTKDILIEPGRYNSCYGECVFVSSYIADLVFSFIIPVSVIIVLYMRVFVVAVFQARAMRSHVTAVTLQLSVTVTAKKSELKAARTLGVLVVVFLASFCPFYCYFLRVDDVVNDPYAFTVVIMYYLNSCLNPLIYALFYPWFRNAVKLIITLQIFKYDISEANIL